MWVLTSAWADKTRARQYAIDALAEAERIYNTKYSAVNRLGTAIKFTLVGGGNKIKKPSCLQLLCVYIITNTF